MQLSSSDKYRVSLFSTFLVFVVVGAAIGAMLLDGQWGMGALKGGMLYFGLLMLVPGGASLCVLFVSAFSPNVADAFSPWRPTIPCIVAILTMFGLLMVYFVFSGVPETATEIYEERWLYPLKVVLLVPLSILLGLIAHIACIHGRHSSKNS